MNTKDLCDLAYSMGFTRNVQDDPDGTRWRNSFGNLEADVIMGDNEYAKLGYSIYARENTVICRCAPPGRPDQTLEWTIGEFATPEDAVVALAKLMLVAGA